VSHWRRHFFRSGPPGRNLFIRLCRILGRHQGDAQDGRTPLTEALRSNDQVTLKQMALTSPRELIRIRAAMAIEHPSFLTAVALDTWDIELGRRLVGRIDTPFLLRRVAASARQDAVRAAAAGKAGHAGILKEIAGTTADLSLRWEIGIALNDPHIMADIALCRPTSRRFAQLYRNAHDALVYLLDRMGQNRDVHGLSAFIYSQAHLPFKLMAFLRLPGEQVGYQLIHHLASQSRWSVPTPELEKMFNKIRDAGWQIRTREKEKQCTYCNGRGVLSHKIIYADRCLADHETVVCSDCLGRGDCRYVIVQCSKAHHPTVEFKLPLPVAEPPACKDQPVA